VKILRISGKDTIPVRKIMLPEDYKNSDCREEDDDSDMSFHLGGFVDNKLVSVASFYFEKHPDIQVPNQYELRGMATLKEFQGQGISSELLNVAFPIIKQNFCTTLWCNARHSALGFYEKMGFTQIGEPFKIRGSGKYVLMVREVN